MTILLMLQLVTLALVLWLVFHQQKPERQLKTLLKTRVLQQLQGGDAQAPTLTGRDQIRATLLAKQQRSDERAKRSAS